jgi:hypothetical protein
VLTITSPNGGGPNIARVAAARKLVTLVYCGLIHDLRSVAASEPVIAPLTSWQGTGYFKLSTIRLTDP